MSKKLITALKKKAFSAKKPEDSKYFHSAFEKIFKDAYSEMSDQNYTNFKIPDVFIEFLKAFPNGIDHLGDDYGFFGIFDCISQTFNDISLWSPYDLEEGGLVAWIHIGVRGDKDNIYLCCDSSSEYFGKVKEFYDGSAFAEAPFPKNMKVQTFEEYCFSVMNKN